MDTANAHLTREVTLRAGEEREELDSQELKLWEAAHQMPIVHLAIQSAQSMVTVNVPGISLESQHVGEHLQSE